MRRRSLLSAPLASLALAGCKRQADLPDLGTVPPFELIDSQGRPFSSAALDGKVWVADFFFTNCPGPCPRMSNQLARIQGATLGLADLRLVSISVDPARDTPEVLAAYARRFRADPARWIFLTGRQDTISNLMSESMHLGFAEDLQQHSTKFVLIDGRRHIRGYYDSFSKPGSAEENISLLMEGIQQLL